MVSHHMENSVINGDADIQAALEAVLYGALAPDAPAHLGRAMSAAVFPGGARIRREMRTEI